MSPRTSMEALTEIGIVIDRAQTDLERNGHVLVAIQLRRAMNEVSKARQLLTALQVDELRRQREEASR